jgi:hypothetical protein
MVIRYWTPYLSVCSKTTSMSIFAESSSSVTLELTYLPTGRAYGGNPPIEGFGR